MICELCGRDPDVFVIMPIRGEDGRLQTIGCMECATTRGVYCEKHGRPHLGFTDDTHACVMCIEEDVRVNYDRGEQLAERLDLEFNKRERDEIIEHCILLMGLVQASVGLTLVRSIVTLARRANVSFEEMVERVMQGKSAMPFTEGKIPIA